MPSGTVTFLLTDVEGSTAAWERDPSATSAAIAELDRLVDEAVGAHSGIVVKPRGEGDSHFCVFTSVGDAVDAGVALLRSLRGRSLHLRVAVHTGESDFRDGDYYGRAVNRAARLRAAAHGGQLLLSDVSAALVREELSEDISFRDLGVHRLKDLSSPERIWEVVHPDLAPVTRPLATLDLFRNNLPLQLTPLIGRERDVDQVLGILRKRRLVTLVALGGTGKTRLSLQVAAESSEDHPGGVWYAELAPLQQPDQVLAAILSAVGGPTDAEDSLAEAVDWIAARELLLVLDNCEHLLDAVAHSVASLLTRCAGLKILATSRQPLEVAGESVFRVPPLGLPSSDDELSVIADSPAVQLFVERGRAVNPDFDLAAANASAIAKLCTGLDGLPLAIELAASRLKILEPDQILERLSDRLALLDTGRGPAANRTVRAAIEWSYDLLKPEDRSLLRRLAIFEGSGSLETIEAVCGHDVPDVALALESLVDHCLVIADTVPGGRRYRLLDLVRAFAGQSLTDSGERETVELARASWFDDFAVAVVDPTASAGVKADFLESGPDAQASLEWRAGSDEAGLTASVLRIGRAWGQLDRWTIGASWVNRALEKSDTDPPERLRLLLLGAQLAARRWEFRDGARLANQALALARHLGDAEAEEEAHDPIATCAWRAGDLDTAQHHNEKALALARLRPDGEHEAATAATKLGLVAMSRRDLDKAEECFRLSMELAAAYGRSSHGMWRLGQVAQARADSEGAARLYLSAVEASRAETWPHGVALAADSLGQLLESEGGLEAAEAHYQTAHDAAVEHGDVSLSAKALLNAARVAARLGDGQQSDSMSTRAFAELAGEPARQIVTVDEAIETARGHGLMELGYDLSRRLFEITLRDGTAKGAAWATYLMARATLEVDHPEEARRLALQARAKFVALGDVDVGRASAAERIEDCDVLLEKIASSPRPSLN